MGDACGSHCRPTALRRRCALARNHCPVVPRRDWWSVPPIAPVPPAQPNPAHPPAANLAIASLPKLGCRQDAEGVQGPRMHVWQALQQVHLLQVSEQRCRQLGLARRGRHAIRPAHWENTCQRLQLPSVLATTIPLFRRSNAGTMYPGWVQAGAGWHGAEARQRARA